MREGEVGAAQRLFAFHEYTAEHSGDWVLAQPWMEDGELCMSSIEELYNFVLRFGALCRWPPICAAVAVPDLGNHSGGTLRASASDDPT